MNSIIVFTSLLREWILNSASLLRLLVFELGEILSRVVPLQETIFRLWLLPAVREFLGMEKISAGNYQTFSM